MKISVEEIIGLEAVNEDRIHLHYSPEEELWKAYDQSALNLIEIVPELKKGLEEELFAGCEMRLYRIQLDSEMMERYELPLFCTLLGDTYIGLQMEKVEV